MLDTQPADVSPDDLDIDWRTIEFLDGLFWTDATGTDGRQYLLCWEPVNVGEADEANPPVQQEGRHAAVPVNLELVCDMAYETDPEQM